MHPPPSCRGWRLGVLVRKMTRNYWALRATFRLKQRQKSSQHINSFWQKGCLIAMPPLSYRRWNLVLVRKDIAELLSALSDIPTETETEKQSTQKSFLTKRMHDWVKRHLSLQRMKIGPCQGRWHGITERSEWHSDRNKDRKTVNT
jgi:hypothetical protein